ncbi:B-Cell Lymphoma 6 Protein [Manis pentadactyla]|nr:B-Cell Lymphoma 6 Protein [Manis pentadactyla]
MSSWRCCLAQRKTLWNSKEKGYQSDVHADKKYEFSNQNSTGVLRTIISRIGDRGLERNYKCQALQEVFLPLYILFDMESFQSCIPQPSRSGQKEYCLEALQQMLPLMFFMIQFRIAQRDLPPEITEALED